MALTQYQLRAQKKREAVEKKIRARKHRWRLIKKAATAAAVSSVAAFTFVSNLLTPHTPKNQSNDTEALNKENKSEKVIATHQKTDLKNYEMLTGSIQYNSRKDLFLSLRDRGVNELLVKEFQEAFEDVIDIENELSSFKYEIVANKSGSKNRINRATLEYRDQKNQTISQTVYGYKDADGEFVYRLNDPQKNIQLANLAKLNMPFSANTITSRFGPRWGKTHKGVDFGLRVGTPIKLPLAGKVVKVENGQGYGLMVDIDHGKDSKGRQIQTRYAHLSRVAKNIKVGTKLEANTVFCYSGNTGRSTGPHLHWEVLVNGRAQNPEKVVAYFEAPGLDNNFMLAKATIDDVRNTLSKTIFMADLSPEIYVAKADSTRVDVSRQTADRKIKKVSNRLSKVEHKDRVKPGTKKDQDKKRSLQNTRETTLALQQRRFLKPNDRA